MRLCFVTYGSTHREQRRQKTLAQPVANCPQQAYRTKTNGSNSKNKITC